MKPQGSLVERAARVIWKSDKRAGIWDSPEVTPAHRANARALAKAGLLSGSLSPQEKKDARLGALVRGMSGMAESVGLGSVSLGVYKSGEWVVVKDTMDGASAYSGGTPESALRASLRPSLSRRKGGR